MTDEQRRMQKKGDDREAAREGEECGQMEVRGDAVQRKQRI